MIPVQGTKPVEPVAHCSLLRYEHAEDLAALSLQTKAYTLFSVGLISEAEIENRPDDLAWAKRKLEWLWQQALPGEPMPPIVVEWDRDKPKEDFF
ncbi:MAG TPA: hypothetical protein VGJ87_03145 [Roseiflexaceae bacterium]|jgi:hypothetical protein